MFAGTMIDWSESGRKSVGSSMSGSESETSSMRACDILAVCVDSNGEGIGGLRLEITMNGRNGPRTEQGQLCRLPNTSHQEGDGRSEEDESCLRNSDVRHVFHINKVAQSEPYGGCRCALLREYIVT